MAIATAATPALPQGLTLSGSLSQGVTVSDNNGFQGRDPEVDGSTSLSYALSSSTKRSSFSIGGNASLSYGTDSDTKFNRSGLRASYQRSAKRSSFSAGLSFDKRPFEFDEEQPDLSFISLDTDRTTVSGNVGFGFEHTPRLSSNVSASLRDQDFSTTSTELSPSTTTSLSGGLSYRLSSTSSMGVNAGITMVDTEAADNLESTSVNIGANYSRTVNDRVSYSGNIGLSMSEQTRIIGLASVTEDSSNLTFGANLNRSLKDGAMSFGFNQGVGTSASGALSLNTGLTGNISRQINERQRWALGASLSRQSDLDGGETETLLRVSPSYNFSLTPKIGASAGYTFSRNDVGDTSHSLSLSISRSYEQRIR